MSVAVVTGGARRVGRHLALSLADAGWDVVLHYHTSEIDAARTAQDIRALGRVCYPVRADLGHPTGPGVVLDACRTLDVRLLVNNASRFVASDLLDPEEACAEEFTRHHAVNVVAPMRLTAGFARHHGRGSVVNVLDARIAGLDTRYFAYAMSRDALAGFTRLAAVRLAPAVRVNAVALGPVLDPPGAHLGHVERVAGRTPLGRPVTLGAVWSAVAHYIANEHVTGDVQFVDSGQHLWRWGE